MSRRTEAAYKAGSPVEAAQHVEARDSGGRIRGGTIRTGTLDIEMMPSLKI